jgi:hypothetical protein
MDKSKKQFYMTHHRQKPSEIVFDTDTKQWVELYRAALAGDGKTLFIILYNG